MTKTNPTRKSVASNAQTIATLALAIALMLAAGCKEEAKPKPGEGAEKQEAAEESDDNLCGGNEFDAGAQFCHNGKLYDLCFDGCDVCDGSKYDPEKEICAGNYIVERCDEKTYNSPTQFCFESAIYDKCGGKKYNISTQFCFYSKENKTYDIYDRCNGEEYAPNGIVSCSDGKIAVDYGEILDMDNGKTYKIIEIGSQTWMAEDYFTLSWADAMDIDTIYNYKEWKGSAEKHRGICPEGWHLPSEKEWEILFGYVGLAKERGQGEENYKLSHYGFHCCPDEYGNNSNTYWSSTGEIIQTTIEIEAPPPGKHWAHAVRCVKD